MAEHLTHTASLPCGYRVTFIYSGRGLAVEWEPDLPNIRSPRHQRKFMKAYQLERDAFMQTVATMLRGKVGVFDLKGNMTVIEPGVMQ